MRYSIPTNANWRALISRYTAGGEAAGAPGAFVDTTQPARLTINVADLLGGEPNWGAQTNHQLGPSESSTGRLLSLYVSGGAQRPVVVNEVLQRTFQGDDDTTIGAAGLFSRYTTTGPGANDESEDLWPLQQIGTAAREIPGVQVWSSDASMPDLMLPFPLVLGAGSISAPIVVPPPPGGIGWNVFGVGFFCGTANSTSNFRVQQGIIFTP